MIEDFQKGFGARLKEFRRSRRVTQEQLAELSNCSQTTIARIESGERSADVYLVYQVAKEFHCDVVWLITGEGHPDSPH